MRPVHWCIDTSIVRDMGEDKCWRLKHALEKYDTTYTEYKPFSEREETPTIKKGAINLLYGSHNFVKLLSACYPGEVTHYADYENFRVSQYSPKIPRELLLNGDGFFLPFGRLESQLPWLFEKWENDFIFVRPDSGRKVFIPAVVSESQYPAELGRLKDTYRVSPETLCFVSEAKNIHGEARHFVVGSKVVSSSWYKPYQKAFGGKSHPRSADEPRCLKLAESVAKIPELALSLGCYTIDTCVLFDRVKVVELNSFSCAGLYDCDYEKVFDSVTNFTVELEDL